MKLQLTPDLAREIKQYIGGLAISWMLGFGGDVRFPRETSKTLRRLADVIDEQNPE